MSLLCCLPMLDQNLGSILANCEFKMPLISEFFGIKIYMYWNEHYPEHFHVEYGECKALVSIRKSCVLNGVLPARILKLVLAWCEIHQAELLQNWQSGKEKKEFSKIAPLR